MIAWLILAALGGLDPSDPRWLALVHYQPRLAGPESEISDPRFFLHPEGRYLPEAELLATLQSFEAVASTPWTDEHPPCRFPARYLYVAERQGRTDGLAPAARCPGLRAFLETNPSAALRLVFASSFLGNPASATGHVFLSVSSNARRKGLFPLDLAINFAAVERTTQSILAYQLAGLSGALEARFTVAPFYLKLLEYSRIEQRDLWSYEVRLDETQVRRLMFHLWELLSVRFDYYFLTDNCAYQLAALLDVALDRPELTEQLQGIVLPVQLVEALSSEPDLLGVPTFHPSPQRQLLALEGRLTVQEREQVACIVSERCHPASSGELVHSAALLHYESQPNQRMSPAHRRLLLSRAHRARTEAAAIKVAQLPPESGHGVHRLQVMGSWADERFGLLVGFRWALHDLLDSPIGHTRDGTVELIRLQMQTSFEGLPRLREAVLLSMLSLPSGEGWMAWGFDLGLAPLPDESSFVSPGAALGVGHTWGVDRQALTLFGLVEGRVGGGPEHGFLVPWGFNGGLRYSVSDLGSVLLSDRALWTHTTAFIGHSPSLALRLHISPSWALDLGARWIMGPGFLGGFSLYL